MSLPARAQNDVIGSHDLSPAGTSPVKGGLSGSCWFCHAPHSGLNGAPGVAQMPLWNTKLSSVQAYTVYKSSTLVNKINPSPPLGTDSTLCLSCHDGTVAGSPGATVAYGQVPMTGKMSASDVYGTNLSATHPVSFVLPLQAAPTPAFAVDLQSAFHGGHDRRRAAHQRKRRVHELPQSSRTENRLEVADVSRHQ